jgi:imidazolonepropionase-like amidohydrolase
MRSLALIMALLASGAAWSANIVFKNVTIYDGVKDAYVSDVHMVDGVVKGVGSGLNPAGADIVDGTGKSVTPGFFNGYTYMGLVEVSAIEGTSDVSSENEMFTASHRAADAVNPHTVAIPYNRALGLSRALTLPVNEKSIFAGQAAVVQMRADKTVLKSAVAQVVHLGQHGKKIAGGSRANALQLFELALQEAADFAANRAAVMRGDYRDLHYSTADLEALQPVLKGEQQVIISVDRAADIDRVLDLVGKYKLRSILLGAQEAWMVADRLATMQVPVIIDPINNLPMGYDSLGARLDSAALLERAGVPMIFFGMGFGAAPHNAAMVKQSAANAVTHGLSDRAAIAALTSTPAKVFGLQHGLAVGKAADMVLWNGHPLEAMSLPERVFVGGEEFSLQHRASRLADRYYQSIRASLAN